MGAHASGRTDQEVVPWVRTLHLYGVASTVVCRSCALGLFNTFRLAYVAVSVSAFLRQHPVNLTHSAQASPR
eukprot:4153666-Prymnesium_polylepis.1